MGGSDQLRPFGSIDAEETRVGDRRRADPHMNLSGACISEHLVNFSAGGCPNDGIINGDNSLTFEQFFYWIQLDLNTEMANSLLGFDERSSYVVISYHPELQGDFRFSRIT